MLFLMQGELTGGYPVPPEDWLELVLKSMEDVVAYREEGKLILHAGFAGRQGGLMIWDVASNEELQRIVTQLPMWPFMDWDIVPLLSTEAVLESIKQALEAVRA